MAPGRDFSPRHWAVSTLWTALPMGHVERCHRGRQRLQLGLILRPDGRSMARQVGTKLGPYQIDARIGAGGMGATLLGTGTDTIVR